MEPLTFIVIDRAGVEHEYSVLPHNADEGFALSAKLLELGVEPLAQLVAGALQSGPASAEALLDADLGAVLAGVDLGEIGKRLGPVIAALPGLRAALLKHTTRDGKKLNDLPAFNSAYQRNYAELYQALYRVVEVNGFLSLPAIWRTSGPAEAQA